MDTTPDGRYVVIEGRRWRATDPLIPEDVAAELRSLLMKGRRGVSAAAGKDDVAMRDARRLVQRAKVGLGERGTPWWEQTEQERRERWTQAIGGTSSSSGSAEVTTPSASVRSDQGR
jgi:hypothetical protein